jgi:hypothetical protein
MKKNITFAPLPVSDTGKPFTSVYLEFVRTSGAEILQFGEFEALRRWILTSPECLGGFTVTPETSHRAAREFFKGVRKERK